MKLKSPQQIAYLANKEEIIRIYNTLAIICGYSLKEQKLVATSASLVNIRIDKTKCYIHPDYTNYENLTFIPLSKLKDYIR